MCQKYISLFILIICNIQLISANNLIKNNIESSERIVFVHVQSTLTDETNHEIRELVKRIYKHTDEYARELLDGNVLSINLNPMDDVIEITDQLQILTDDQLRILEMSMMEMLTVVNSETKVDITIAWL